MKHVQKATIGQSPLLEAGRGRRGSARVRADREDANETIEPGARMPAAAARPERPARPGGGWREAPSERGASEEEGERVALAEECDGNPEGGADAPGDGLAAQAEAALWPALRGIAQFPGRGLWAR